MNYKNFTIGADPELFFYKNNEFIPSSEVITGGKKNPVNLDIDGMSYLKDNLMAEFNIPPSNSVEEFKSNLKYMKDFLLSKAQEIGATIKIVPTAKFSSKVIYGNEDAAEFGCEPDLSIYMEESHDSQSLRYSNLRFAGGHIHIGYNKDESLGNEMNLVELLDILLAIPFVIIDKDFSRRTLYGKAGKYRVKKYGIEYRTLSNIWIENDELIEFVYKQVAIAVRMLMDGTYTALFDLIHELGYDIKDIVNNSIESEAIEICEVVNIELPIIKYETTEQ